MAFILFSCHKGKNFGGGAGFEPEAEAADLQSAGFDRSPTPPVRAWYSRVMIEVVNKNPLDKEKILSKLIMNLDQKLF